MKTKYFKYVYILLIALILFIAGSYAFFSWGSATNSNTNVSFDVVAETVYIEYDAGSDIVGANLYPVDDKSNGISKTITVKTDKVVQSKPVTFNLYLDLTSVPTALLHSSFKWAVYTGNDLVSSGNLTDSAVSCNKNSSVNHIVLFSNEKVTTTEKKYVLYLWIDGTGTDNNPDDMMNKSFEFNLHADGDNALLKNLFNVMEKQAILDNKQSRYVSSSSGIDFSQISSDTNGKGVYIKSGTENDTYPIYYYRGAVDNNNVIFANFCWKIVRTTETGGIKLIYNGVPSNGTCNNTGENSQIGTSVFNKSINSPAYVGYMYGTVYTYSQYDMSMPSDIFYYGKNVTYSNGVYTLSNSTTIGSDSYTESKSYQKNYHYTCFSDSNTCSNVYYIYHYNSDLTYYITLTGGKKVEDALSEMLDYNITDSTIKGVIDNWYKTNMTSYTNKLEDTVWCNDREISSLGGFSPSGAIINSSDYSNWLFFGAYGRLGVDNPVPKTTCSRKIDSYTISSNNGNGKLIYPVGLPTVDELVLAGVSTKFDTNSSFYLNSQSNYWLASPSGSNAETSGSSIGTSGEVMATELNNRLGVRPCISLSHNIAISSGDGTANSPYVIE